MSTAAAPSSWAWSCLALSLSVEVTLADDRSAVAARLKQRVCEDGPLTSFKKSDIFGRVDGDGFCVFRHHWLRNSFRPHYSARWPSGGEGRTRLWVAPRAPVMVGYVLLLCLAALAFASESMWQEVAGMGGVHGFVVALFWVDHLAGWGRVSQVLASAGVRFSGESG